MVLRKEEISTLELKEPPGAFRLGDRTPVTERIRPAQEAQSVGDVSQQSPSLYCRGVSDSHDRGSHPSLGLELLTSNPFFRVFQFSCRQQRLEASNWELACLTNPRYD